MAEAVLFDIAGEIIMKLGSLALQEIGLWWGLKDEFEKLKKTTSAIQAVILDAEKKSAHNNQIKDWLGKLREVIYDADDLLDDFSTEALHRQVMDGNKVTKEVGLFFSRSNTFVYGIKMAHKIKAIRERLDSIEADRRNFHFEERLEETKVRDPTDSSLPEVVIGREDDKKEIVELLLASNCEENVSVISIVGIGGLGKTTLAQLIFNDERVTKHFELKLWVCVSDPFDVKMIVKKILECLKGTKSEDLELETLKNELGEKINKKKYLLVLDDVWNENREKWENLKKLLIVGASGSKIVVNTRSRKVAEIARSSVVRDLKGLSPTQSWSLFSRVVFKEQEPVNQNMKSIGEKIIEKCVGVPLAIKTIASLLCFKNPETEWPLFLENELSKITQDEIDILPTLKLSYDNLSSNLKHCFAYCALFPKDYVIDVKKLIHLWIAQGFINESSNRSQCVEDVALEYFIDLCWRSFFQEVQRDEFGNVVSCKMHDLMHDLATLVAGTGIKLINLDGKGTIDERICHLLIRDEVDDLLIPQILKSLYRAKKLRTYLRSIDEYRYDLKFSIDEVNISKFRRLRTFDLHHLKIENLPSSIKKLKQLRYIDVSYTPIVALPNSICELHNLQVLNVSECEKLKELPKDIRKLINLRHLYNKRCWKLTHMPRGIGQLTSLQTLSWFVVGNKHNNNNKNVGGLNELNRINNLRGSLEIRHLERVKSESYELCNLKEKQHLQSLTSSFWYDDDDEDDDVNVDCEEMLLRSLQPHPNLKELNVHKYEGMRFPSTWFSSLTNLISIGIYSCKRCEYLPPLNEIPSLQKLEILYLPDLENIEMEGTTTFFPSLKYMSLRSCPKLMGWLKKKKREDDYDDDDSDDSTVPEQLLQFPCLSTLDCFICPKLTWLPQFPSLDEYLSLCNVSAKLVEQILTPSISYSSSSSTVPPLSKLKMLFIWGIKDLESLPVDGMQNLTSLQELEITDCPRLKSLPQEMLYLTSLRELTVNDCPQLEERCRNKKGEDWPIIAHIQKIEVGYNIIQEEGRYSVDEE